MHIGINFQSYQTIPLGTAENVGFNTLKGIQRTQDAQTPKQLRNVGQERNVPSPPQWRSVSIRFTTFHPTAMETFHLRPCNSQPSKWHKRGNFVTLLVLIDTLPCGGCWDISLDEWNRWGYETSRIMRFCRGSTNKLFHWKTVHYPSVIGLFMTSPELLNNTLSRFHINVIMRNNYAHVSENISSVKQYKKSSFMNFCQS